MPKEKYGNLPFAEAVEFFRKKGLKVSEAGWRDVWQQAQIRSFTVARVTAMDVLIDIKKAVDDAVSSGQSLGEFKRDLRGTLEKKGWFAPKGEAAEIAMPDGTIRKRLTGWRLETIYNTNLQTSYSVGRNKQMTESSREYWQYRGVSDEATRPDHAAQFGKVYHRDHPYWDQWYPPNGFGCRCYVVTLSERQVEQRGLEIETKGTDLKPDDGWRYNPAKEKLGAWKPDLKGYPEELKEQFKREAQVVWD